MAGCLIPHTPIAVDYWKKRDVRSKICFLSHMHTDHTQGLTSSWDQTIFCSEITRSLAIEQLKIKPSLLVAIPVGQSTIIPLDNAGLNRLIPSLQSLASAHPRNFLLNSHAHLGIGENRARCHHGWH